ncbi:hypothetical protein ACHAPT_012181 [Fusarium lateritium]
MFKPRSFRLSNFCEKQWWFLPPEFSADQFRYKFHEHCRLPFTKIVENENRGPSNYSTVQERSIHVDHIRLWPDQTFIKDESGNPRVAVKELINLDSGPAKQEADVLGLMRKLQNDHLIEAIAYYQHGRKHNFMFPWAKHGNLWQFLIKNNPGSLEKPYLEWIFKQLLGLAVAIDQLHNLSDQRSYRHGDPQSCRHGDLKPENILCFGQSNNQNTLSAPAIRLVITDVGLAKQHQDPTQLRQFTNTLVSTKRYAAPELDLDPNGPRSRRFDIWSMGCIFLEVAIWALYGPHVLEGFTNSLKETFYETKEEGNEKTARVHPIVEEWVSHILKDWRCSQESSLGRLVNLIDNKLLIVNTKDDLVESPSSTEPPGRLRSRPYSNVMREELERILQDLETGRINAIGERPPGAPETPKPPEFAPTEQDTQHSQSTDRRRNLTDSWIYTPDNTFTAAFFRDADFLASFRREGEPQLCPRCRHLPLRSIDCHFTDSRSGLDIKAQKHNCELCKLLSYCIRGRSYSAEDTIQFARVGSHLTVADGKREPVVNLCALPGSNTEVLENIQTGFAKLPDVASEVHFKMLREWIRSCDSTHHCIPEQVDFVPTRLLYIGELNSDVVRLVENSGETKQPMKYVALSHRWGSPEHHEKFCATRANINALKADFKVSNLPKTFYDAVLVTRKLGLTYLWIDSICIIQDDAKDWYVESKLMEQVFSSAYCTLAASCASGTNNGFLKARPERRCIPMTSGGVTYYACENIDDFTTHVDQSELNQRGWVMQERALSRRTIYFAENQSYWECGGGVRCETMTKMNNRKASFLGDADFPHSAEKYVKGLKIEFFQDLYVRYSKLALSFASDRPIAIKGLENRLLSTFNTTGGYGVLDCYFHRSLLWKRGGDTLSRIPNTRGELVPSWSWMAYSGAIDYVPALGGKVSWLNNIKSPFSRAPSDSSHHEDETLALEAPVRSIINDPPDGSIFLDEPTRVLTQPMECVILGSGSPDLSGDFQRHWVILVHCISNADASGGGVYERLGVAVLEGRHIDFQGKTRESRIK